MPLDEAIAVLLAKAQPTALPNESVGTFDADGRVLAQDLVSGLTVPPRDNSAMDGYAGGAAHSRWYRRHAASGGHGGAYLHRRADP